MIPLFVQQASSGRRMMVTDPNMTHFLISLCEAVLLVEHAFASARAGYLYVRKAPASKVEVLAGAVADCLGLDTRIEVIGTCPGEKLYETLTTREELVRSQVQGHDFRVAVNARDLNYGAYYAEGSVQKSHTDDYHSHNAQPLGRDEVAALLSELPGFQKLVGVAS